MQNLRIVYDNVAKQAATLAASSTAGSLVASNLLTDFKNEVWRATSTTATLTLTWVLSQTISCVALPFSNLQSTSKIKVDCYTETTDVEPAFTTGEVFGCPSTIDDIQFGQLPLGVNATSFGGGACAVVWFAPKFAKKIVVTIIDTTNPLGFVEAGNLVVGNYWSPEINCPYGVQVTPVDATKKERTDAGSNFSSRGPMHKTLSLDLQYMDRFDRNTLWSIMRKNGTHSPLLLSVCPESEDTFGEQIYQVYGTLSKLNALSYSFYNQFDTKIEIEEI